jgi:hypothetical protein
MAAAESDSDTDDEYNYGEHQEEYYLKHGLEYNYGSNEGVILTIRGVPLRFSRFGDEKRGVEAVGPVIEKKIQELLGDKVLEDYNNILDELVIHPHDSQLHERLRDIFKNLRREHHGPLPAFNYLVLKIVADEGNRRWSRSMHSYFMVNPKHAAAATTIQSAARKRDRIKTRKQVAKVMLKGQEDANTGIVGAKHVRDNVSSFLTGRARGGTKKKRRKRRKKSKKKHQKKRTKRKRH